MIFQKNTFFLLIRHYILFNGLVFMKTLLGFRNLKKIDEEISKINIALALCKANVNDIASATVSKPSLSEIHSKKKHQDTVFVKFVDDIENIRKRQDELKHKLEYLNLMKNAVINSIEMNPSSEMSDIIKSYFIDGKTAIKISSELSLSVPAIYKQINSFFDSINKLAEPFN